MFEYMHDQVCVLVSFSHAKFCIVFPIQTSQCYNHEEVRVSETDATIVVDFCLDERERHSGSAAGQTATHMSRIKQPEIESM